MKSLFNNVLLQICFLCTTLTVHFVRDTHPPAYSCTYTICYSGHMLYIQTGQLKTRKKLSGLFPIVTCSVSVSPVASDSCPRLTGVKPDVVFSCCGPFSRRFDVVSALRWFLLTTVAKGYLSYCSLPVGWYHSDRSSLNPTINKVFFILNCHSLDVFFFFFPTSFCVNSGNCCVWKSLEISNF